MGKDFVAAERLFEKALALEVLTPLRGKFQIGNRPWERP
jgi:hypothetical protein